MTKLIEMVIGVPEGVMKGQKRGGDRGNPNGGGAGRNDPGVDELDTIEIFCPNLVPDQPDHQH
jgi:hypothetical protein